MCILHHYHSQQDSAARGQQIPMLRDQERAYIFMQSSGHAYIVLQSNTFASLNFYWIGFFFFSYPVQALGIIVVVLSVATVGHYLTCTDLLCLLPQYISINFDRDLFIACMPSICHYSDICGRVF